MSKVCAPKEVSEMSAVQHDRARHSSSSSSQLQAGLNEAQRHLLHRHAAVTEKKKRQKRLHLLSDHARRACNREHMLLLDAQLACVGVSLQKFMASPRFEATAIGLTRRDTCIDGATHFQHVRADGTVTCEYPLSEAAFEGQYTWHLCQDQGPKGFSALSFLWHEGCRGTYEWDMVHRVHNDWSCAISSAGLGAVRSMMRKVMSVRAGPFKSQAHQGLLKQCIEQLRASNGHAQPLWSYFYPDVFQELHGTTDRPEYGTAESIEDTFHETLRRLEGHGPAGVRLTRWFSFEQKAEELAASGLSAQQYLLTYAMVAKGHWKAWHDTPMGQGGLPAASRSAGGGGHLATDADADNHEPSHVADDVDKPEESMAHASRTSSQVNNSISVAVAVLCQTLVTRSCRGLVALSRPLRATFGELLTDLKSPAG
eukprot:6479851-Amphidinium_carterae.2